MNAIGFASPWLLLGLAVLPVLWWLLRVTPPAPRRQEFPAIGLLLGLSTPQTMAARTPWWLLLLRLAAAGLAIVGLAGPVRNAPRPAMRQGSWLLVIDNGWASAPDWAGRVRAAADAAAQIAPAEAPIRVLATAPEPDGAAPMLGPVTTVADLPARLAVLHPQPWPPDRGATAAALAAVPAATHILYIADGLGADTAGDARFAATLQRFGSVAELRGGPAPMLLRPPQTAPDRLELRAETLPGTIGAANVRALASTGEPLARTALAFAPDGSGSASLVLPPALLNHVDALRLEGGASAGGVVLLDEGSRRRPVGLLANGTAPDTPLTGTLYYVRRALADTSELRTGDLSQLLGGGVSVIVLADQVLGDAGAIAALTAWVRRGGVLVRFAGPDLAASATPDPLLPVTLLAGGRSLGGAMSWSRPAALAAFPPDSPFNGLTIPDDVRVTRQVLAQPGNAPDRPGRQDWALLADGTPLVTAAPLGAGRLVLFHVTANADWSNLPLSGLFPRMLQRLVALSVGVRPQADNTWLAPRRALDGFGQFTTPGAAATPLTSADMPTTIVSPRHPPGLYGPDTALRAFNLGAALPRLTAAASIPGAVVSDLNSAPTAHAYGAALLACALVLLSLDLIIALRLRGLLGTAAALMLALLPLNAHAVPAMPSLATHLAYIQTGDPQADGISKAGLQGLSDFVNSRTSAVLAEPAAVDPAHDDLSFYPLIYWPVLADTPVPDGATLARLDDYMANGGIIVFDTRDAGAPDAAADATLAQIGQALSIPALTPLTSAHVLSRSFYLLRDWPGLADGGTVWVARGEDPGNDGVSPVILGSNNWAAAWAVDADGNTPYEPAPGGERQRLLAYRFGVNLVMYALTGNYKADQVHVPELLRRMGQDPYAAPGGDQDDQP
jgi:hypothetical protein